MLNNWVVKALIWLHLTAPVNFVPGIAVQGCAEPVPPSAGLGKEGASGTFWPWFLTTSPCLCAELGGQVGAASSSGGIAGVPMEQPSHRARGELRLGREPRGEPAALCWDLRALIRGKL